MFETMSSNLIFWIIIAALAAIALIGLFTLTGKSGYRVEAEKIKPVMDDLSVVNSVNRIEPEISRIRFDSKGRDITKFNLDDLCIIKDAFDAKPTIDVEFILWLNQRLGLAKSERTYRNVYKNINKYIENASK